MRRWAVMVVAAALVVLGCSTNRQTAQADDDPRCVPAVECGAQGKMALQAKRYGAAHELFGVGCELGDTSSCWGLAVMFAHGTGVPADLERAEALFRRGCGLGDERACEAADQLPEDLPPLDEP